MPSRFPTLSVTAFISDTERRKKFNSLIKFGGLDAQDESVPEGEDAGQQRSLGFLDLNHFLCDGKEFRDLSYCSNKVFGWPASYRAFWSQHWLLSGKRGHNGDGNPGGKCSAQFAHGKRYAWPALSMSCALSMRV